MIGTAGVVRSLASSRGMFLTAVLAGSLAGVGFMGSSGGGDHTVTARFSNADGLVTGNEVRVAGVPVGVVSSVAIGVDGSGAQYASVSFSVDAAHWPLHRGTTVAVRPKGVLSNVFVDVEPGSDHNPSLGDAPFFGTAQTSSPVNLDALTNVFQPTVRDAIRTQLQEGVLAFGGAGATSLNGTLANANPLTLDAIPVIDVLATRSPQLDNLNFEFDTISRELADEDSNLRPLIANLDTTLGAIASRETDLQGTLVHAAAVFTDLSQALASPTTQADLQRIFSIGGQALTCAAAMNTYLSPVISAVNPYISYTTPFNLDMLLGELVTATGFNTPPSAGLPPPTSGNTLRVQELLPSAGYLPHDTGGLTLGHNGYVNASATPGGPANVYEEQPPLTGASTHPTLSGCAPPAGLP